SPPGSSSSWPRSGWQRLFCSSRSGWPSGCSAKPSERRILAGKEKTMSSDSRAFQEKTVTLSNGLKLHSYAWPGPRPNLVLLHPSSGYGRMWEATATALGAEFHVYALDQRGHGDSARPDGEYSAEEDADDLHLFFRQVGIDKAIVAGQSLGGRVGQVFAAVYHAEIQGLGLVGGPHTSNFFPTREEATKVLNASHRMLESQTEFASRERRSPISAPSRRATRRPRFATARSTPSSRPPAAP